MTNRKDYLFKKTKKNKIMSIYKKLFEAKKEIGKISKDSTNPFFKSKYFDINSLLEHVEPILQKHDLLLLQPIQNDIVCSEIWNIDEDETKEKYVGSYIKLPSITDPQKLGSAITYYRRYTLQSLLGLQAEDDDANTATKEVNALPWLNVGSKEWNGALSKKTSIETLKKYFRISKANSEQYLNELNK